VAADSAGYAGEFYTQRHIIRAMVEVVRPKLGEKVYDPCFGTAGFLGESAEYIRRHHRTMNARDLDRLQHQTFFGREIKPLTYLLGTMNMLLHRIEGANLELTNTLEVHSANVPDKNKYDVILANLVPSRKIEPISSMWTEQVGIPSGQTAGRARTPTALDTRSFCVEQPGESGYGVKLRVRQLRLASEFSECRCRRLGHRQMLVQAQVLSQQDDQCRAVKARQGAAGKLD
jgi:hypothetical protein